MTGEGAGVAPCPLTCEEGIPCGPEWHTHLSCPCLQISTPVTAMVYLPEKLPSGGRGWYTQHITQAHTHSRACNAGLWGAWSRNLSQICRGDRSSHPLNPCALPDACECARQENRSEEDVAKPMHLTSDDELRNLKSRLSVLPSSSRKCFQSDPKKSI